MITVPTRDLCGILADVLPFTGPDDYPLLHTVRIHWDGNALHAQATDRYRIGWSTWNPDDQPGEDQQPDLFTEWGGADDTWSIIIDAGAAKDLVTCYKLPAKEGGVPLTVDCFDARITVDRARETGYSALTAAVPAISAEHGVWPDVEKWLADASKAEPVREIAYTPKYLADFAKVRSAGPMYLTFTGAERTTLVSIGERFRGGIMPVKTADGAARQFLQEGTGLLVGSP